MNKQDILMIFFVWNDFKNMLNTIINPPNFYSIITMDKLHYL